MVVVVMEVGGKEHRAVCVPAGVEINMGTHKEAQILKTEQGRGVNQKAIRDKGRTRTYAMANFQIWMLWERRIDEQKPTSTHKAV